MATKASRSNFYFVNPSEPLGTRDAYGGESPARVFERTSWEWLWERYLRRREVLAAMSAQMPTDYLADRKGAYSVLRHVPRTRAPALACNWWDGDPAFCEPGWALPGQTTLLPTGERLWVPADGEEEEEGEAGGEAGGEAEEKYRAVPRYGTFDVVCHAADLGGLVAGVAMGGAVGANWFRDPDDADPSGKTASGSATETSSMSYKVTENGSERRTISGRDSSEVSVTPMGPWSFLPVFRLLGDFRADDAPVAVAVPVWDPASARYVDRTAYFSRSPAALRPGYGEYGEFAEKGYVKEGTATAGNPGGEVRTVRYLRLTGLTSLSGSFGFPWRPDANFDDAEGTYRSGGNEGSEGEEEGEEGEEESYLPGLPSLFNRHGKSGFEYYGAVHVGLHVDPPAPERGGVGTYGGGSLHPSPDWDGRPTCWSAWGFPKIPSYLSGTPFGRQLAAFCRAQPAPPPWTLLAVRTMPAGNETEDSPRPYNPFAGSIFESRRPDPGRPYPVACPCEPSNVSGMLDKMTRTVTEVTGCKLFAHVSYSRTDSEKYRSSFVGDDSSYSSWSTTEEIREAGSFLGTFGELLGVGRIDLSVPGSAVERSTVDSRSSESYGGDDPFSDTEAYVSVSSYAYTRGPTEFSATGIVLLRDRDASHEDPYPSLRLGGETRSETVYDDGQRTASVYGYEGDDADGWVPDDADLLVSPDVAAWARSAELIAFLDVEAVARDGDGRYRREADLVANTESVDASMSRTSHRKMTVVRLGSVDLGNGTLDGAVSWAGLGAVPSGAKPYFPGACDSYEKARSTSEDGVYFSNTVESGEEHGGAEGHVVRVVSARLFLSVEWDFDTDDPPEPKGQASGCAKLARKLALLRGRLSAASRRKASADNGLEAAAAELEELRGLLETLETVLETGESAYADELRDAREALEAAETELEDAREALEAAETELASVPPDDPSRSSLEAAVAAARDVVATWTEAVAAARSRLDGLVGLEEASLEDAAAALDALEAAIGDLGSALDGAGEPPDGDEPGTGLSGAADEALSGADEALSGAEGEARSCSSGAEGAVDAAEGAVDALLEALRGTPDGHGDAFGGVFQALSAANAAAGVARRKTWAAVSPST